MKLQRQQAVDMLLHNLRSYFLQANSAALKASCTCLVQLKHAAAACVENACSGGMTVNLPSACRFPLTGDSDKVSSVLLNKDAICKTLILCKV